MNLTPTSLKQTDDKNRNDWCTPPWLFKRLHDVFTFELDGAATKENALCYMFVPDIDYYHKINCQKSYYNIFCNPPFNNIKPFLQAYKNTSYLSCFLLPFRPETKIWHELIWPEASIFIFNKRIQYVHPQSKEEVKGAAFPSCLVIFGNLSRLPIQKLDDLGVFVMKGVKYE